MQTIDIGVNLTNHQYQHDLSEVLKRASLAEVSPMIITGTSVRASQQAASLAAKHPQVLYSTAGVHPHDAKGCDSRTIAELRKLCGQKEVVAVGECGLDYDRDFSPRDVQRKWFEAQIDLANELNMPLFLHERAAFTDFYKILKKYQHLCNRAVVHCFTGTRRELEAYLELGCFIGITGWVCDERRGLELRKLVNQIPSERLMIETDAPFLLPRNMRPQPKERRNEPAFLAHIAADIATCRGESTDDLAAYTSANATSFFNLG